MIALRWFFFFLWNASSHPGSIQHGAKDLVSTYFWIPATSNPLSNKVNRVPPPVLASGKKKHILLPREKRSMHFGFVFNHFWHSVVLVKSDLLHLYKIFSLLIIWTAKIRGQALVISQLNFQCNLSDGLFRASITCLQSLQTYESYLNAFHIP